MVQTLEAQKKFSKKIQSMFTAIAPQYDFLNRLLSFGMDRQWRKTAVNTLALKKGDMILDIATGTADMALEIVSRDPRSFKVFGLDFSFKMLQLAKIKTHNKGLNHAIRLQIGDGGNLPFLDDSFHGITSAFGIRNFEDVEKGLTEKWRVLKPQGRVVIIEFSLPRSYFFRGIYLLYFRFILPFIGQIVSGHRIAYKYLPESVLKFPEQLEFAKIMMDCGFSDVTYKDLTFGIATIYKGFKYE